MLTKKKCRKCKIEKKLSEFYKTNQNSFGYTSQCKQCRRKTVSSYRKNNKSKINATRIKSTYGITIDEWKSLFEKQKGCCAICETHQSKEVRTFHTDHCHTTGKVRGLLCRACNHAVGNIKEDINIALRLVDYIDNHC
ncbi:hypothetical protein LCGC14_2807690 [marine sediment metagenome]|uniref:Recombination endonuclease VII n=1 Tax=marine sediment metagenome TaxID=412755 RepID=A0A0F8YKT7_9ZZZZ